LTNPLYFIRKKKDWRHQAMKEVVGPIWNDGGAGGDLFTRM